MGIETNLDVSPYFDDTNNALNDNYHRILFRPSVPVQARELTQLQDILQNQIERFGDNIFVAGTIIKGCNFNFDSNYYYAKIKDLRPLDSQPANPSQYGDSPVKCGPPQASIIPGRTLMCRAIHACCGETGAWGNAGGTRRGNTSWMIVKPMAPAYPISASAG